uniref:Uncharacterized protein n=1 Tax=Triticum urartu TaxID=4572 RepID=A0A8R7P7I7_TRIUA
MEPSRPSHCQIWPHRSSVLLDMAAPGLMTTTPSVHLSTTTSPSSSPPPRPDAEYSCVSRGAREEPDPGGLSMDSLHHS